MCLGCVLVTNMKAQAPKATEVGFGWSGMQFNRVTLSGFTPQEASYEFDMQVKNIVYGGNLYLAQELNKYFYLDLQGTLGYVKDYRNTKQWFYTAGLGLQHKIAPYFNSKYIDPYLRVGVGYMYKDFAVKYKGEEFVDDDRATYAIRNINNKYGLDRKHLVPISIGFGVNMWLNDHIGLGMQGDYVIMPYKNVANSIQGTFRIMFRFGGETKKTYRDVPYPVAIAHIVKEIQVDTIRTTIYVKERVSELISNIHFDFDSDRISESCEYILDDLANTLQNNMDRNYLIIGSTDSKGSSTYNQNLSERRAIVVMNALIDRGVPAGILKARGIGKQAAYATPNVSNDIREGDRKVTIEIINNNEYWNYLK